MRLRPGFRDKNARVPYEDLLWALLNSNEFGLLLVSYIIFNVKYFFK